MKGFHQICIKLSFRSRVSSNCQSVTLTSPLCGRLTGGGSRDKICKVKAATTSTSVSSQRNLASTIVSSIASTLPPRPPTLVEEINEDEVQNGGRNGGVGGCGGEDEIKILTKGTVECWNHFERVQIKGKVKAICYYCKKILASHSNNGTKALNEHYKRCKRRKGCGFITKSSNSKLYDRGGGKRVEAYTCNQNFSRRELACMIIMHEYPLSVVEHVGFKRFTLALQPLFQMVSLNTHRAHILKIHDGGRLKAMKVIEKTQSRVAVTIDMWTLSNVLKEYLEGRVLAA